MPPVKQNKYTFGFQYKLISFSNKYSDHTAAKMFRINECSVHQWKKNDAVIQNMRKQKCVLCTATQAICGLF